MRFYIRTLGCKMNQLDSARLTAALVAAGHEPTTEEDQAEVVLVNSCTVTAQSDQKSRKAARAALRSGREVAVFGCGPRADASPWHELASHALIFREEAELLRHFHAQDAPRYPMSARTRLPVAIQTGCDDTCSFCITRIARGAHHSLPAAQVIDQVREAHARGVQEVVLTGINLAAWGCTHSKLPAQSRLHELLAGILGQTGIPRIRLSSLGPQYLGEVFFEVFSDPRICAHLHLSVQSGSPSVLRRMDRGHDAAAVHRTAEQAREVRPGVALTADLIAGFPGETEQEARETVDMVERIGFAKLHVFPFSPRAGTPAATLPDGLDGPIKKARAARLRALGRSTRAAFVTGQLGRPEVVLVEDDGTGLTGNYIRLRVPGGVPGRLYTVQINAVDLADRW